MSLKQLVNTPHLWDSFIDRLEDRIEMHRQKLERSTDPIDMYKAQGAIAELKKFKLLKEELKDG